MAYLVGCHGPIVTRDADARALREATMPAKEWPRCRQCGQGVLLPLSDYGPQGSTLPFKVWVCHHLDCGYYLRIDKGVVTSGHLPRPVRRSVVPARRD